MDNTLNSKCGIIKDGKFHKDPMSIFRRLGRDIQNNQSAWRDVTRDAFVFGYRAGTSPNNWTNKYVVFRFIENINTFLSILAKYDWSKKTPIIDTVDAWAIFNTFTYYLNVHEDTYMAYLNDLTEITTHYKYLHEDEDRASKDVDEILDVTNLYKELDYLGSEFRHFLRQYNKGLEEKKNAEIIPLTPDQEAERKIA